MAEDAITVEEAARLLGVTARAVRKQVLKGKLKAREIEGVRGHGGKKLLIEVGSLPEEARATAEAKGKADLSPRRKGEGQERGCFAGARNDRAMDGLEIFGEEQQEVARFRYGVIRGLLGAIGRKERAERVRALSAQEWEIPQSTKARIHEATIYRWVKQYQRWGIAGLVRFRRNDRGKKRVAVPEEVEAYVRKLAVSCDNAAQICDVAQTKFRMRVPYRLCTAIVREETQARTYRTNRKQWKDGYEPAATRDREQVEPNEAWYGDSHPLDVLVWHKDRELRPWVTAWMDYATATIVGWCITPGEPNQERIKLSLGDAIRRDEDRYAYGVPKMVWIDHGKDFVAQAILAGCSQAGIVVRMALPYNAQAKAIERWFGTMERQFGKAQPGWIGSHTKERPQPQVGKAVHAKLTYETLVERFGQYVVLYHQRAHKGLDGLSPMGAWERAEAEGWQPVMLPERQIPMLFAMRQVCVVSRGEVRAANMHFYDHALLEWADQKVEVRFHPDELSSVAIFSLEGPYICQAQAKELFGLHATQEQMQELGRRKKRARARMQQHIAEVGAADDLWQEIYAVKGEWAKPEEASEGEVIRFDPELAREAQERREREEEEEATASRRRRGSGEFLEMVDLERLKAEAGEEWRG